jgi:hypothetical protein
VPQTGQRFMSVPSVKGLRGGVNAARRRLRRPSAGKFSAPAVRHLRRPGAAAGPVGYTLHAP